MAYLGSHSIQKLISDYKLISPDKEGRIKCGAYELSLGEEVFQTDSSSGKKEHLQKKGEQVVIKPGQFALLLTEEKLRIPSDKIAFISIKAGIKLKGLINVSGFHVDPGFIGKLIFSVYNAGPATIILEKGSPYFLIWFSEIEEEEAYNGSHKDLTSIPVKYIEALKAGELASPNALSERINKLSSKHTFLDWFYKLLIGLLIGICIKLFWDKSRYEVGFQNGYKQKGGETLLDSKYKELNVENEQILIEQKRLQFEIDSLKTLLIK